MAVIKRINSFTGFIQENMAARDGLQVAGKHDKLQQQAITTRRPLCLAPEVFATKGIFEDELEACADRAENDRNLPLPETGAQILELLGNCVSRNRVHKLARVST